MATQITTSLPNRMGRWACTERVFTAVFPVGFEPPAHLVKRIRVFFPPFVPLLRIETFRTPANTDMTEGRYCIGRWAETPDDPGDDPIRTERPLDFPFHAGVIYVVRPWVLPVNEKGAALGLPDGFLPFDDRLVNWMDAAHQRAARTPGSLKAKVMADLMADQEYKERELEKLEEDFRLRLLDDKRQIAQAIDEERWESKPHEAQPYTQAAKVMDGSEVA